MSTINTTLTTSGNSVAVRLPKDLLRISGLGSRVQLEAKKGKIIISKVASARAGWNDQIKTLLEVNGDPTREFDDMDSADGAFNDLLWSGPSFEEWQEQHAKLS